MTTPLISNKVALIMACNYSGTPVEIQGPTIDGERIYNFIIKQKGFPEESVKKLFDRDMTKDNILLELENMAAKTQEIAATNQIPQCFLYFSGLSLKLSTSGRGLGDFFDSLKAWLVKVLRLNLQGASIEDKAGDQAILPFDYEINDFILDNTLYSTLIENLHPSTELFAFTDCAFSGTMFDLKYQDGVEIFPNSNIEANVIALGGSRDNQFSYTISGKGIATSKFLEVMDTKTGNNITTVQELEDNMKDLNNFRQIPIISVSKESLIAGPLFSWIANPMETEPDTLPTKGALNFILHRKRELNPNVVNKINVNIVKKKFAEDAKNNVRKPIVQKPITKRTR